MLMLEERRLRLVGNSDSDGMGGPHGRRRGGGVAPMPIRKPDAPVVSDPAAAAHGVVVRKRLNVSNLPTMPSIVVLKIALPTLVPGGASGATEKKQRTKPIGNCITRNLVMT
jgi:hypothetical protein